MREITVAVYTHLALGKRVRTRYKLTAEEAADRLIEPIMVPGTEEVRPLLETEDEITPTMTGAWLNNPKR